MIESLTYLKAVLLHKIIAWMRQRFSNKQTNLDLDCLEDIFQLRVLFLGIEFKVARTYLIEKLFVTPQIQWRRLMAMQQLYMTQVFNRFVFALFKLDDNSHKTHYLHISPIPSFPHSLISPKEGFRLHNYLSAS